jgi:hypothetical protein
VLAYDLEHLADVTLGRPGGHDETATGPTHAQQFGGNQLRAGSEHDAEHADDDVEARIGIRQLLGVAFVERSSSPAPQEASTVPAMRDTRKITTNFRHVLRRRVQRQTV